MALRVIHLKKETATEQHRSIDRPTGQTDRQSFGHSFYPTAKLVDRLDKRQSPANQSVSQSIVPAVWQQAPNINPQPRSSDSLTHSLLTHSFIHSRGICNEHDGSHAKPNKVYSHPSSYPSIHPVSARTRLSVLVATCVVCVCVSVVHCCVQQAAQNKVLSRLYYNAIHILYSAALHTDGWMDGWMAGWIAHQRRRHH